MPVEVAHDSLGHRIVQRLAEILALLMNRRFDGLGALPLTFHSHVPRKRPRRWTGLVRSTVGLLLIIGLVLRITFGVPVSFQISDFVFSGSAFLCSSRLGVFSGSPSRVGDLRRLSLHRFVR